MGGATVAPHAYAWIVIGLTAKRGQLSRPREVLESSVTASSSAGRTRLGVFGEIEGNHLLDSPNGEGTKGTRLHDIAAGLPRRQVDALRQPESE